MRAVAPSDEPHSVFAHVTPEQRGLAARLSFHMASVSSLTWGSQGSQISYMEAEKS